MPELAATMLRMKGMLAQFHGRLWEAIALTEGARRLAEQHGLTLLVNRANLSLANILALDDPLGAVAVEREVVEYARRTGQRESETITIGNMAEDVRRTGDWDWIVAELRRAITDDFSVNNLLLEAVEIEFRIFRGEASKADVDDVTAGSDRSKTTTSRRRASASRRPWS